MQLFQLSEPSNAAEPPGLSIKLDPTPHVHFGEVPGVGPFVIQMTEKLAQEAALAVKDDPSAVLYAGDLTQQEGKIFFKNEVGWRQNKKRGALVHLSTQVGERGKLFLTGPRGPGVLHTVPNERPEVIRPFIPFKDTVGVHLLTDDLCTIEDDGFVHWNDSAHKGQPPLLLISLVKGATFRVQRTGRLEGAPSEFTVTWTGNALLTRIHTRSQPFYQRGADHRRN